VICLEILRQRLRAGDAAPRCSAARRHPRRVRFAARTGLLALGALWSIALGWQLLRRSDQTLARRGAALAMLILAIGGILWPWIQLFYVW